MTRRSEQSEHHVSADWRRLVPRLILVAAVCAIQGAILTGVPLQSANDRSRWATVWSLIHRRTWQIDEIDRDPHWATIDKVRHRSVDSEPWHFYSSKPPLLSGLVAVIYGAERRLTGVDLRRNPREVTRSILLLVNGIPMACALWMFSRLLRRLQVSLPTHCCMMLVAGFGSMLNPYLSVLNNHTPAAVCLLVCLVTIVRMQCQQESLRGVDFALVGLTAALTSCFELPAALFGVVSFVWMMSLDSRKTLVWYVPAAVVPLAAYFITNWDVTGGIRPFYAFYGTEKYVYTHCGVPSYWSNPQGLDANKEALPLYAFHCLLGHHGLLSHTPMFVLSIWGWLRFLKTPTTPGLRGILPVGALVTGTVFAFYLSRTQNYNYGGNSAALRWMLWLTPFLWFAMLQPLERLLQSRVGRGAVIVLLSASVMTAVISLPTPWTPSWIYGGMVQAGWIDYRTPVASFESPRQSVVARWPADAGVTGRWISSDGHSVIQIVSGGVQERSGKPTVDVQLSHDAAGTDGRLPERSVACVVQLDAFAAGAPVVDWLFSENSDQRLVPANVELVRLLQGMPSARAFQPSGIRYFQLTPASNGFRCQRAASRVQAEHPQQGRCWYRCDVWYCDDVPYGVLRWKQTVTRADTREVIHTMTWTAETIQGAVD